MTLHINLPVAVETALFARAAAEGKEVSAYIAEVVAERLANTDDATAEPTSSMTHAPQGFAGRLQAWIDLHPRTDRPADDSRESIYAGRE